MDTILADHRSAEQRRPKLSASALTWVGRAAFVLFAHLSLVGLFWLLSEWRQSIDPLALNIELVTAGAEVLDATLIDAPESVAEASVEPFNQTVQPSAASAPTPPQVEPLPATASFTTASASTPVTQELNERSATDQEPESTDTVPSTPESRPVTTPEPTPTPPQPAPKPAPPQPPPQRTPKPAPQPQPTTAKQAQSQQPPLATQPIAVAAAPMATPDVGPKPTSSPKPPYPPSAFKAKQEGKVVLELEVLEDGAVGQVRLAQSSTVESLDESALTTVKKWKYSPAQKGGQIVKQWIRVSILFEVTSR
jgi:protein TonB